VITKPRIRKSAWQFFDDVVVGAMMNTQILIQLLKMVCRLILAMLASMWLQTSALAFSMFPVRLAIDASHNVATLSVTNPTDQDITLQPRVFKWTQESVADGVPVEKLVDSAAFTIFPPLVNLKPQSKQTIRIRYNGSISGVNEEAFRVITENLLVKPTPGIVNFTNAISIPLFVRAKVDRNPELVWSVKRTDKDTLQLDLDNSVGNRHIQITEFSATKVGVGADGTTNLPVTYSFMQYLLPNTQAKMQLDKEKLNLPAGSYRIQLKTDYKELAQTVELK
jgi:P pilus assembly chaperone PapD